MAENLDANTHNERTNDSRDGTSEDKQLVAKWTRKWLFKVVQFIYDADATCAVPNGRVYQLYKEDLSNRLVGVKLLHGQTEKKKEEYIETFWKGIMKKKTNIVTDGLNARRGSVYSAMQNRFIGKPR